MLGNRTEVYHDTAWNRAPPVRCPQTTLWSFWTLRCIGLPCSHTFNAAQVISAVLVLVVFLAACYLSDVASFKFPLQEIPF